MSFVFYSSFLIFHFPFITSYLFCFLLKIIFEDDGIQVCCEIDLISKVASKIWSSTSTSTSTRRKIGNGQIEKNVRVGRNSKNNIVYFSNEILLLAVDALCNAGVERVEIKNNKSNDNDSSNENDLNDFELDNISQSLIDNTIYCACREGLLHLEKIIDNKDNTNIIIKDDIHNNENINDKNSKEIITLLNNMKIDEDNISVFNNSSASLLSSLLPSEISKNKDIQKLKTYRNIQSNAIKEIFKNYLL